MSDDKIIALTQSCTAWIETHEIMILIIILIAAFAIKIYLEGDK